MYLLYAQIRVDTGAIEIVQEEAVMYRIALGVVYTVSEKVGMYILEKIT